MPKKITSSRANRLDYKTYAFPIGAGEDTKIGDLALPAPYLKRMRNAVMEKTGTLKKRRGFAAITRECTDGTTLPEPLAAATYDGNLLNFADQGLVAEYGQGDKKWVNGKGPAYSLKVSSVGIQTGTDQVFVGYNTASVNDWQVTAWMEVKTVLSVTTATVKVNVTDATGTVFVNNVTVDSRSFIISPKYGLKVVALGNLVYVFWMWDTPEIKVLPITCTDSSHILSTVAVSPVQVATDVSSQMFDVVPSSHGILLLYITTTAKRIKWGFVSTAGVLANTTTYTAPNQPVVVSCAAANNGTNHLITYIDNHAGANDVYARHYSFVGTTWTLLVGSAALDTGLVATLSRLVCDYDSDGVTGRLWATGDANPSLNSTDLSTKVYRYAYDTSGTSVIHGATMRKSFLQSKPFTYNGERFYLVYAGPQLGAVQPVIYVVRDADATVVGKFFEDIAYFVGVYGLDCITPDVQGNEISFALISIRKIVTPSTFVADASVLQLKRVTLTFDHPEGYKTVEVGDALYLAGDGFLRQYDGNAFTEADFIRFVDHTLIDVSPSGTPAAGGAFTPGATYYYWFIPEAESAKGEVCWGTTTGAVTYTADPVTPQEPLFWIPTLIHTNRSNVRFAIYCSPANDITSAVRIGQVANDKTKDEVAFQDSGVAVNAENLYMLDEVDNVAPPSCHLMCTWNGRVFLAGAEIDPCIIFHSKQRVLGRSLNFNDSFTIPLPAEGGPITGLEALDRALVAFKRGSIYLITGDGPSNDINSNQSFYPPQLVSTDTGCIASRSIVVTPGGIMFQSVKGIYMLDRAGAITYIGEKVESSFHYRDDEGTLVEPLVVSSLLVPKQQQVRFYLDDGNVVVYDYFHKIWYGWEFADPAPGVD